MTGGRRARFLLRRLAQAALTVLAVVVLDFGLLKLAPGDAADVLAGEAGVGDVEYVAQLRAQFGLDRPVLSQLDLGWSFRAGRPVAALILERLPATLLLMGTGLAAAGDVLRHLLLPAGTLSLFFLAPYTRLVRASMLEVAGMEWVRTARAKGLAEGRVLVRHVLRNALVPLVTMVGLQAASLLGGSVLIKTVFSWPGLGRLMFEAVFQRDLNLLLSILVLSAVLVVAVNLALDLLYAVLNPAVEAS